MDALTVRLPESLRGKACDLAEEGISMNQLVTLAVSEKITRLDAEAEITAAGFRRSHRHLSWEEHIEAVMSLMSFL